jgi:hypothetical protein
MFLSAMTIWGGLTCILSNPADRGPISQLATQWAHGWQAAVDPVENTVP